jgi:general L-amino acid transport system permease protein
MTTTTPQSSSLPPEVVQPGVVTWLKKNLFSSWHNTLLTVVVLSILSFFLKGFWVWATSVAKWQVIPANMSLYMVGLYPQDQRWRMWIVLGLLCCLSGITWGVLARNLAKLFSAPVLGGIAIAGIVSVIFPVGGLSHVRLLLMVAIVVFSAWIGKLLGLRFSKVAVWLSTAWVVVFFITLWLIRGGLGLESVPTSDWGGLKLTLLMAVVSIILCFPMGVLLALGRRSDLPVVRWLCTAYIELIRGVPLISILFMGQVMIPMFLPEGVRPDRILRAIVGLTIFSAAYLAENVRGGLQAIPRGQSEAARALGLNPFLTTALIVMPQALKISIPSIVGQFISLFQDTTLLSIVGLVELLGISRSVLANPDFLGRYAEVYVFDGVLFWVFCYAMSVGSRKLEEILNTGHR